MHVGGQQITPEHDDILRDTWPGAPDPKDLPTSCIVGMVRLGQGESKQHVASDSPWALGPLCYRIEEAIEFREVVKEVKGTLGLWNPFGRKSERGQLGTPEADLKALIPGGTRLAF